MMAARPDANRSPQHRCQRLHLGCGTEYRQDWVNVDINPDVQTDFQFDATETPWTQFDSSRFQVVESRHLFEHFDRETKTQVFRECGRVLVDGGILRVTVPLGVNHRNDDDHENPWTWETPTHYCQEQGRHWDPDVPFILQNRRVRNWMIPPLGVLNPAVRTANRVRPGLWATELPLAGGELTAVYRRVER